MHPLIRFVGRLALIPLAGVAGGAFVGALTYILSWYFGTTGYSSIEPFSSAVVPEALLVGAGWGASLGLVFGPLGYCLALLLKPVRTWSHYSWLPFFSALLAGSVGATGSLLMVPVLALGGYFVGSFIAWRFLKAEAANA